MPVTSLACLAVPYFALGSPISGTRRIVGDVGDQVDWNHHTAEACFGISYCILTRLYRANNLAESLLQEGSRKTCVGLASSSKQDLRRTGIKTRRAPARSDFSWIGFPPMESIFLHIETWTVVDEP